MLLAEANQWPEDVVEYFGDGDECHMAFHFPVMPRMFMGMRREDATPIYEILDRTPAIPDSCQWGLFLRNHDELTLEMVTDEERDYMYSEYAKDPRMKINVGIRRRLAPLLDNGRDDIELMHAILFSLPGSPVLYYGDEIAMGDNVFLGDRDGVRTPMQWTPDRNGGFSRADFAQLYAPPLMDPVYGYQAVNVEAQLRTPTSLLRWLRRFISLRKDHPVFGMGTYEPLRASNHRIFAHIRRWEDDIALCVHNLARTAQAVELDLTDFEGRYPEEMFGRTRFPQIGATAVPADARPARLLLVPAQAEGGGPRMTAQALGALDARAALVRREVRRHLALRRARHGRAHRRPDPDPGRGALQLGRPRRLPAAHPRRGLGRGRGRRARRADGQGRERRAGRLPLDRRGAQARRRGDRADRWAPSSPTRRSCSTTRWR